MHTVDLFHEAISAEVEPHVGETVREVCCITGEKAECIDRKVLGNAFTTQQYFRAPTSNFIGLKTFQVLRYKWERMSCWVVTPGKFYRQSRTETRQYVLNGIDQHPWAGYVTTSYKKHGALITPLNGKGSAVWRFENLTVDCSDNAKVNDWFAIMDSALRSGINRTAMETLTFNQYIHKAIGFTAWLNFEKWAKDKYLSPLYQFLCYLMYSKEEIKAEKQDETPKNEKAEVQKEQETTGQMELF